MEGKNVLQVTLHWREDKQQTFINAGNLSQENLQSSRCTAWRFAGVNPVLGNEPFNCITNGK